MMRGHFYIKYPKCLTRTWTIYEGYDLMLTSFHLSRFCALSHTRRGASTAPVIMALVINKWHKLFHELTNYSISANSLLTLSPITQMVVAENQLSTSKPCPSRPNRIGAFLGVLLSPSPAGVTINVYKAVDWKAQTIASKNVVSYFGDYVVMMTYRITREIVPIYLAGRAESICGNPYAF